MSDTEDGSPTNSTGAANAHKSPAKQGRMKLNPNPNHDIKQERRPNDAKSKRTHHCPAHDCYGPIVPRCYKLGHVVDCPKHGRPHLPRDPCVQCEEEAGAIDRSERNKKEEAAKAEAKEAEETVGGFLENLKRSKDKKEKQGKQPKDKDERETWSTLNRKGRDSKK